MKYVVGGVWLGTITLGFLPLCGWNRYVYEVVSQPHGLDRFSSNNSSQGYLYSSTVDFLAVDPVSLSYTWVLMLSGFIFPNIFIISSHLFVCNIYRSASASASIKLF